MHTQPPESDHPDSLFGPNTIDGQVVSGPNGHARKKPDEIPNDSRNDASERLDIAFVREGNRTLTKDQIANALEQAFGLVSYAAKLLKCKQETIRQAVRKSKRLQRIIIDAKTEMVDAAEMGLRRAILGNEAWALAFSLKTVGRNRGYSDNPDDIYDPLTTVRHSNPNSVKPRLAEQSPAEMIDELAKSPEYLAYAQDRATRNCQPVDPSTETPLPRLTQSLVGGESSLSSNDGERGALGVEPPPAGN